MDFDIREIDVGTPLNILNTRDLVMIGVCQRKKSYSQPPSLLLYGIYVI